MDVNFNSSVSHSVTSPKTVNLNQTVEVARAETTAKNENGTFVNNVKELSRLSVDDVKNITQEMNKFLQLLNADLQFTVHEKTKQLMVQVVDTKTQKVLKEYPRHEFLDTIAKIRDYVGLLLDKKV